MMHMKPLAQKELETYSSKMLAAADINFLH